MLHEPVHRITYRLLEGSGAVAQLLTGQAMGDLPVAERMYSKLLSLPTFTDPAKELIDQYIEAFQKVAENSAAIRTAFSNQ